MKQILVLCLFCTCFLACSDSTKYTFRTFNPESLPKQVFKLPLHKDTILKTQGGIIINFKANTFDAPDLQTVEISVQEIMNKADMLKSGFQTVDEKGHLLESAGMIRLITHPKLAINPKFPIEIRIPTLIANPNMKKYTTDVDENAAFWKLDTPLTNQSELKTSAQTGENLFIQNCSICHSLDRDLTGPALGCLEIGEGRKNRNWLISFTKNSQKMIRAGDSLAVCAWNNYKPVVMSNFDSLSDLQINQIFNYINQESLNRNLCSTAPKKQDCNPASNRSSTFNESSMHYNSDTINVNYYTDTECITYTTNVIYYTFSMTNYKWLNCDTRLFEGQPEVGAFEVTAAIADLEMNLIFRNRNAVWNFWNYENQNANWKFWNSKKLYRLLGKEEDETMQLPIGEPVTIFAFKKMKNGQIKFGSIDTQVQKQNKIRIELKNISEAEFEKILNQYK